MLLLADTKGVKKKQKTFANTVVEPNMKENAAHFNAKHVSVLH